MYNSNTIEKLKNREELFWINPNFKKDVNEADKAELTMADIFDAEKRLNRFAPVIMTLFPETVETDGIFESPLIYAPGMKKGVISQYGSDIQGELYIKMDGDLKVAGSIKARGGIYEVLKHAEDIALQEGIIRNYEDDYRKLLSKEARNVFSQYKIQVGSTGNLGISIGIMSAALGFTAVIHMSHDAKQWKKDLLRSKGATVFEYEDDYSAAVEQGRMESAKDPNSYFVDDEHSMNLFVGYAVAALRLKAQLDEQNITVDENHPLFVYLPCGVGGAPGGICWGLKLVFGNAAHCFYMEPVESPCMLLGLASGKHNQISVQDIGLTGKTHADGLAVGRPSGFVGRFTEPYLSGIFTISDAHLFDYLRILDRTDHVFMEPSSCAAFQGVVQLGKDKAFSEYVEVNNLRDKMAKAIHIAWATGGSLVPDEMRKDYLNTFIL